MLERYSWHEQAWLSIEQLIKLDRLPHAFLFWGQAGLGKKTFARQLAGHLLCSAAPLSCGRCQGCHWYRQSVHPDFITLEPQNGKKKINVEQIRDLQLDLSLSRSQKTPRVILIKDAEKMNVSASNALLKSLEEPSESCVYLLVANTLSSIPPTIQSRCQTVYFPPASFVAVEMHLRQNGQDINQAGLLSGSPLLADDLLSDETLKNRRMIIDELMQLSVGEQSPCTTVSKWGKVDDLLVLRVLYEWFSDLIKLSSEASQVGLIYQSRRTDLERMLKGMHKQKLFTILDKIVLMIGYVSLARQINVSLWFDDLAIDITSE